MKLGLLTSVSRSSKNSGGGGFDEGVGVEDLIAFG